MTILEIIAMLKNVDGLLFSGVITAISGIGWLTIKLKENGKCSK